MKKTGLRILFSFYRQSNPRCLLGGGGPPSQWPIRPHLCRVSRKPQLLSAGSSEPRGRLLGQRAGTPSLLLKLPTTTLHCPLINKPTIITDTRWNNFPSQYSDISSTDQLQRRFVQVFVFRYRFCAIKGV